MFKILDVDSRKISACAVMMYKGYEISVSTVFEGNIAVFLDQDDNKQEYYVDKDGNKMTNLEQAIEFIDMMIKVPVEVVLIRTDDPNYDNQGCRLCPYDKDSTRCGVISCVGGFFRSVK